jgi:hypothetical protein
MKHLGFCASHTSRSHVRARRRPNIGPGQGPREAKWAILNLLEVVQMTRRPSSGLGMFGSLGTGWPYPALHGTLTRFRLTLA